MIGVSILSAAAGAFVAAIIVVAARYGAFARVTVAFAEAGGETAALEPLIGPYAQCGKAMDRVYYALLETWGVETTLGVGLYYDDPKKIEASKLRSEAGCILRPQDEARKEELSKSFVIRVLPRGRYATADFPYRGRLSVLIGVMKVYPALARFASRNGLAGGGPMTEIYDLKNGTISYRLEAPLP